MKEQTNSAEWTRQLVNVTVRYLVELESRSGLKRGLAHDAAVEVCMRMLATLDAVGSGVLGDHIWFHRHHHRNECDRLCAARDLYCYLLDCMPTYIDPCRLPLGRIAVPLVAGFSRARIVRPDSFHDSVARDRRALRVAAAVAKTRWSEAQKRLARRYVMTLRCCFTATKCIPPDRPESLGALGSSQFRERL